jgi:hypothetical protein
MMSASDGTSRSALLIQASKHNAAAMRKATLLTALTGSDQNVASIRSQ